MTGPEQFKGLLKECLTLGGSDLHLSSGALPMLRRNGRLEPLSRTMISEMEMQEICRELLHSEQAITFKREHTVDLAISLESGERFRVNVFRELGRTAMAIRRLDERFRTFEELHLPMQLAELADLRDGLVLVTGPTGSGKTTTLATLIHQINCSRACHILTVEDPVEYIHQNELGLVHHRELYSDVRSFPEAIRSALREDPDVILVGEMRDLETMRAAITAAETGHLVYSTLHTGDAVGAIERMVGLFPGDEQQGIRQQLSMVLRSVVAQRLLPGVEGNGRIPAIEILHITQAVGHLIRSGKSSQIYSAIESGSGLGMQTLEQSLAELSAKNLIRPEDARRIARDPDTFDERFRRHRSQAALGIGER